jgi:hypothetical protein
MSEPEPAATIGPVWAYWPDWRAPVELVVRSARVAAKCATRGAVPAPCRIDVSVWPGEDVESFDSVEEFKTDVTTEALRRFDYIEVVVGRDPQIIVAWAKGVSSRYLQPGPSSCPWLERGVLLVVTGSDQAVAEQSRTAVARVLARGWGLTTGGPYCGVASTGDDATLQQPIRDALAIRRRLPRDLRITIATAAASVSLFALIVLSHFTGFPLRRISSSSAGYVVQLGSTYFRASWWLLAFPIAGLLVGWFVIAPLLKFTRASWPSVAIGESGAYGTRLMRSFRNESKAFLVTTVVSLVGALVLALFGIHAAK